MEFFNSAVDTLQTIVVGLGGALCGSALIYTTLGFFQKSEIPVDIYRWFSTFRAFSYFDVIY